MNRRLGGMLLALLFLLTGLRACAEDVTFLPVRTWQEQRYSARPAGDLTTILLIGYDHQSQGLAVEQHGYASGGQADFLLLIVLDHEKGQIHQLSIDRDTMSPVKLYGATGTYLGTRKLQICLAHAYGDTQETNNRNTVWAVEKLLGIEAADDGAQIDWYLTMDISGISVLNDLLGGVTVPIDEDFTHLDPAMQKGSTLTLQGIQAEYYCRQRYDVGDQSNTSRMARQRTYLDAVAQVLKARLQADSSFARTLLDGLGVWYVASAALDDGFGFTTSDAAATDTVCYLMTDESLEGVTAAMLRALDYEQLPVEELPGEHVVGTDGYMQCIIEENAGTAWALGMFYDLLN